MTMLLYSLALTLGLTLASPWWLTRMITTQRYREGLRQRLGFVPATLRQAATDKKVIWLHAVSVGEVLAATRLVSELEAALGAGWLIVISTTTRTGQHLAKERFGAERTFYMPLDFAFAVRAYMRVLQPQALVLMESELWPRLLHECAIRSIPVIVANARVSDRTFTRTLRFRKLWQRMARHVTLFLAQSGLDAERLKALGSYKTHIRAVGNLKYDVLAPKANRVAGLIAEAAAGRPIIVAGSTVASTMAKVEHEEAQVVESWMRAAPPLEALLVVAPRHPERFDEVWKWVHGFPSLRASDLLTGLRREDATAEGSPERGSLTTMDIILLDTIGDLSAVYGIATIAYVGGSLFPRGGHNPLEPAQFGVPVVMGPSYENFRDIVDKLQAADAIRIAADEIEITDAFEYLLTNREAARAMGERGRQVFEQQQGATQRTVDAILTFLKIRGGPSVPHHGTGGSGAQGEPHPGAPSSTTVPSSARVGQPQNPEAHP